MIYEISWDRGSSKLFAAKENSINANSNETMVEHEGLRLSRRIDRLRRPFVAGFRHMRCAAALTWWRFRPECSPMRLARARPGQSRSQNRSAEAHKPKPGLSIK